MDDAVVSQALGLSQAAITALIAGDDAAYEYVIQEVEDNPEILRAAFSVLLGMMAGQIIQIAKSVDRDPSEFWSQGVLRTAAGMNE